MRALAARSGVSHSSISLMERDAISPSVDTLNAVLDALGSTLPSFFQDLQPASPRSAFLRARDLPKPNRSMLMLHET